MKRGILFTAMVSSVVSAAVTVFVVLAMLPAVAGAQTSPRAAAGLSAGGPTSLAGVTAQAASTTVGQLQVVGADGQTVRASLTANGLQFTDQNGKVRYSLTFAASGDPTIAMFDASGGEIWSAP